MATKKSKSSNKADKAKSTQQKTAEKSINEEVEATNSQHNEESETTHKTKVSTTTNKSIIAQFFGRKYEEKESILTVFKKPSFYGALLGEVLGTMLLTLLLLTVSLMGIANIATYAFATIAILIAVYAISGACLNPLITAGMMASRRMSVIRGVMYIIAEILGAWLGWLIISAFRNVGGDTAYEMPAMAAIGENGFPVTSMIELMGASIIGFFFARALEYKRSVFTFAAVTAGGIALAVIVGYVISAAFLGLNNNFIFNPATAIVMQIFPTSGDDFGQVLGGVCQALSIYAIFPMIGGIIGFYLSDITSTLSSKK